jgi:multisubunit Na+/H+ antiporter MnhG subunit
VITFSIILSTTGMIQLNQAFNGEYLASIFVFIGSILVAIGVICIFGVVDLNTGKK